MMAHSLAVCQCSSRNPPAVSLMFTPARVLDTGSSRTVTSRDHSPVVNTLVRKGEWVLEILHQALGVRPRWPHGIRVLAIEYPIGWTRVSRVGCTYHFLQCRKAADRYGGFPDETPTSEFAHNYCS